MLQAPCAMRFAKLSVCRYPATRRCGHCCAWSRAGVARRGKVTSRRPRLSWPRRKLFAKESPEQERDLLLPDVYANQASSTWSQGSSAMPRTPAHRPGDRPAGRQQAQRVQRPEHARPGQQASVGDADTARAYFLKAVDVAHQNGLTREAMDAIANFSAYLDDAGDHAKAAELFRESAALLAEAGDEAGLACAVANQGVAWRTWATSNGAWPS